MQFVLLFPPQSAVGRFDTFSLRLFRWKESNSEREVGEGEGGRRQEELLPPRRGEGTERRRRTPRSWGPPHSPAPPSQAGRGGRISGKVGTSTTVVNIMDDVVISNLKAVTDLWYHGKAI